MKYRPVTEDEFDRFLADYPNKLAVDVCGISEPPTISHNDFTLGAWPDSVVARCNDEGSFSIRVGL